jgi:hypothetical protein
MTVSRVFTGDVGKLPMCYTLCNTHCKGAERLPGERVRSTLAHAHKKHMHGISVSWRTQAHWPSSPGTVS